MVKIFRTTVGSHITINGKKYANVDEMPPDVRKQYEQAMQSMMADKDHNGVPDILEHPSSSASFGVNKMQSISVNGKHYDRLEDVPQEFRDAIGKALARQEASATSP